MKITAAFLIALAVPSWADTTTAPDFHQTCDDVLNLASQIQSLGQNANTNASQKLSYCQAAQQSQKAASSNGLLWKVWSGVAGVCAFQCVGSMSGIGTGSQYICTGADVAAGVTDAVTTKNFMGALTAIGSAGAGILINKAMNKVPNPAPSVLPKKKNWGACIAAATATMSVFTKKSAETQAVQTENQNLVYAAQLGSITTAFPTNTYTSVPIQTDAAAATSARYGSRGVSGGAYAARQAAGSGGCGDAASSGNTGMIVSCASASDPSIPKSVGTPEFNQALKQATGTDLGGFVANATDPNAAITSAAALPGDAGGQLSLAVAAVGKAAASPLVTSPAETTYANHGGGPPHGADAEESGIDPSIGEAMAKLMKGLHPGQSSEPVDPHNIQFPVKSGAPSWLRGPASEDDRAFSLFDRVTYRYYFVGRRMLER